MTDPHLWAFDETLGGTFAQDKEAAGLRPDQPLPALDEAGSAPDDVPGR